MRDGCIRITPFATEVLAGLGFRFSHLSPWHEFYILPEPHLDLLIHSIGPSYVRAYQIIEVTLPEFIGALKKDGAL